MTIQHDTTKLMSGSSLEADLAYKSSRHLLPLLVKAHHDKTVGIPLFPAAFVETTQGPSQVLSMETHKNHTSKPFEVPAAENLTYVFT